MTKQELDRAISGMYNAPIWQLHRIIYALLLEVQTLRRQVANAAQAGEKAA